MMIPIGIIVSKIEEICGFTNPYGDKDVKFR